MDMHSHRCVGQRQMQLKANHGAIRWQSGCGANRPSDPDLLVTSFRRKYVHILKNIYTRGIAGKKGFDLNLKKGTWIFGPLNYPYNH